ncbi:hypothetical protein [Brucella intermedia]|uniref:hypothetical protein n=1 Tax=Brucella intermedia TaxID=94625 RepID=UPI00124D1CCE|nr:hypothetical protein [Brucella intermedia]KAB2693362.1 hypothetical protein F9K72_18010 [Brucella intermedia]
MKQKFSVAVTKYIDVTLDTDKLDADFWEEFNSMITDRGGPDNEYLAEHIAWNFVQGDDEFVEGVGDLKEMNISVAEAGSDVSSEVQP